MVIIKEILRLTYGLAKAFFLKFYEVMLSYISLFADEFNDKRLGIKTLGASFKKEERSEFKDEVDYEATPYSLLKEIASELKPKKSDVFIDMGCGKGRVPIYFSTFNIKKSIGIELRKSLFEIAQNNVNTLKQKHCEIEIINQDVLKYNFHYETIIFMFNPFGWRTMMGIIGKIKASLRGNKRKITVVYFNPIYELLFIMDTDFKLIKRIKKHNLTVAMYRIG